MNLFELFVKIGVKDEASGNLKSIGQKLGNGLKTAAKIGTAAVGAASAAITALTTQAVKSFAEYEQLAGGAQKIFDQMDYSKIAADAQNAYKELGLSANQYLAVINDVGATFAATMGDEAGYEAAKTGLKAISDYASGTGKNVDELSQKFTLITRSTSSYQSIADQFSGILPATSAGFLEQAQAAGILSDSYTQLTEVPIDEYQAAVSQMLEQGVADLGLAGNTAAEAAITISGSLAATKAAWSNMLTAIGGGGDVKTAMNNLVESAGAVFENIIPVAGEALSNIGSILPSILESLLNAIIESSPLIISGIVTAFQSIVTALPVLIQQIADALPELVPQIISGIAQMVVILVKNLPKILASLVSAFLGLFAGAWDGIKEVFSLDKVQQFFSGIWDGIKQAFASVGEFFSDIFSNAWSSVENAFASVGDFFSGIWENIKSAFGSVAEWFGSVFSDAWASVTKVFSATGEVFADIGTGILDALKTVVNAIIEGLNFIIKQPFEGLNDILDTISGLSIAGAKPFAWLTWRAPVPQIPLLEKGGVLKRGQIGLLEGNGAEAVVPLEKNTGWIKKIAAEMKSNLGVFGGNIVINIEGAKYSDENALAEAIANRLQIMADRRAAVYV